MDLTRKLALSYYKTIAAINESHKVYLVQHRETGKIYVKKILDVYNADVYRYLKGNPVAGTPDIVDYFEEDNQLILIEEYIAGDSLEEKIRNGELSEEDMLGYMLDLCDILQRLHSIRPAVIHRDIKPSNVVITKYNRAVLLDFNAAKYYSPSASEDTVLLGTQGYAAPEQYGFGSSSPQTDVYALGILMKEMLASIDSPSDRYEAIVRKCTKLSPSERFRTAQELRAALTDCGTPDTAQTRNRRWLPPGFRSGTPWKMILSSVSYVSLAWVCLTMKVPNVYGPRLWTERVISLLMMLFLILACSDYMGMQRVIPLCSHPKRSYRYLGIFLLNAAALILLEIVQIVIQEVFFPV